MTREQLKQELLALERYIERFEEINVDEVSEITISSYNGRCVYKVYTKNKISLITETMLKKVGGQP